MNLNMLKSALAGLILCVSSSAYAALINYDVILTADSDFSAFGGGLAGDKFYGTFSIDDSLVGGGIVFDPGLTGSLLFLDFNIAGTIFSDITALSFNNGLRFAGGPLLDISFNLENSNGDILNIFTAFEGTSNWSAYQASTDSNISGNTFGVSVVFNKATVPEPATLAIFALGIMGLSFRRMLR
jgi:hypothetical protein